MSEIYMNAKVGSGHGGFVYVNWNFGISHLTDISFDITFHQEPTGTAGTYIQLYDFPIGKTGQYFGFQHCQKNGKITTQFIWSRWETRDIANAKVAKGGWIESADYENDFVGLRFPYQWGHGIYTVHLAMRDTDANGLWYELRILDAKLSLWTSIGCLRFPLVDGQPPLIKDGGGSWCEIFGGANNSNDVAPFHLSYDGVFACDRKVAAKHAKISYNDCVLPNSDISLDANQRRVHIRYGSDTVRKTEACVFDLK